MEKLTFSAFDFFSYALPGTCILMSFAVLDPRLHGPAEMVAHADQLGIGAAVLLTVLGYVVGFSVSPVGRALYKTVGFRIWNHHFEDFVGYSVSEKYILLRERSPSNFKYVETWNVLSAMSHNLAIACLFVATNVGAKLWFLSTGRSFWIGVLVVAILLFFLLLHRAVVFYRWAAVDINAAMKVLALAGDKSPGTNGVQDIPVTHEVLG